MEVPGDTVHNHIQGNLVVDRIQVGQVVVDHIQGVLVVDHIGDGLEVHILAALVGLEVHSLDLLAAHILGLYSLVQAGWAGWAGFGQKGNNIKIRWMDEWMTEFCIVLKFCIVLILRLD